MPTTLSHPDLPSAALADALRASGFEVRPAQPAERTVLDTFDGRLHAAGLRLEHRSGADAGLELRADGGSPPARLAWAKAAVRWPAELPAGPFRSRVASVSEERALLPVVTIGSRVQTAIRADRRGKVVLRAELHDEVVVDGAAVEGWWVELNGVAGHDDDLERAITRLGALGLDATDADLVTTVAGHLGRSLEGHSASPTVPLEPDVPALTAYRRVLANLAATIDANLEGTVDDVDVEFLHELRVAVRRTRSVLSQGKGVLPDDVRDRYRQEFGWLGQVTGPARDLDVYVLGWDDYVAPLELADQSSLDRVLTELEARRLAAHRELATTLRGQACRDLLHRWWLWLADLDVEGSEPPHIGPVVAARIAKAQRTVLTDGRAITPESPAERLHDLRKDTKKLRYLLECFGSLFPAKPRKAFVDQLKALQDNLGEHQDAEVHLAELRDLAHDLHARRTVDTDALLAMGRLSDHLDRRRVQERAAFVERFAAYDTKANREALDRLLDGVAQRVKVAATYSIKGGVGKTSTAVNLAFEAARAGVRVLVWDLDPQGAATFLLRVRPKVRGGSRRLVGADGALAGHVRGSDLSSVHVVPADFSLRHLDLHLEGTKRPTQRLAALLEPLADDYDLALLDCPPSISLASESVFGAADALLVPVVPATLASRTLTQLVDFLDDQVSAPMVLPILSMVDRRRKLHRELAESLTAEWPTLPTAVPSAAVIERMGLERAPVGVYAPSTAATRAYRALWAEVAGRLWSA